MEINIEIKYDNLNQDLTRDSDELFRDIQRRFPEGLWERTESGYRIIV